MSWQQHHRRGPQPHRRGNTGVRCLCGSSRVRPCSKSSLVVVSQKMLLVSRGWVQCYWCPYWVHTPHVIDGLERPLCGWCLHWFFFHDGDPYEPTARRRAARVLQRWWGPRHHVNEQVRVEIASFLIERHVP